MPKYNTEIFVKTKFYMSIFSNFITSNNSNRLALTKNLSKKIINLVLSDIKFLERLDATKTS